MRLVIDEWMDSAVVAERLDVKQGTVSAWASEERMRRRTAAAALRKQAEESAKVLPTENAELKSENANLRAQKTILISTLNEIRELIRATDEVIGE